MKPHEANHRRRIPFIEQMQQTECGLCCMAMLMSFYKSSVSLYDMREVAGSGRDGTTLKQLSNLASHLDFDANWYKVTPDQLHEMPAPSILFWEGRHYVVLEKVTKSAFCIVDPALGRRKLQRDDFTKSYTGYLLTCRPNENFECKKAKSVWTPFIKILWENPKLLASILGATIVLQLLTLGVPMLIQRIIDGVIMPARENLLDVLLLGIVLLVLFQTGFTFIKGKLLITLHNFLDHQMMTRFFKHILNLPYQFFQLRSFGDLLFRASSLRTIRNLLADQLIKGFLDVGLLIVILAYMFSKSVTMTVWVVLISGLSALLVVLSRRLMTEVNQEEITKHTNLQGLQTEVFYGIFGIKTAGTEKTTYHRWNQMFKELLAAYRKKETVLNYVNTANGALKLLAPLVVLWLGARLVFGGSISLGGLVAFHALANQFFSLTSSIVQTGNSFILTDSYLRRVQDVLDAPEEHEPEQPVKLQDLKGDIELNNVSLAYTKYSDSVIKNISLKVKPGQKIAVIGKSGAGKSTLARLILGLYQPSTGDIYYDGYNLMHLDKPAFRKQVGVVPQDVSLFNRSIKENITTHNPDATMDEIIKAAKVTQIHDEIMKMPMQYNTIISEMGMNISGGQRQRIALARALVHKPSILVLDEATSSLDHVNEQKIDEYLSSINCTRVVISHRLTSLVNSDLILVLDKGELIECGTHEELLSSEGFYNDYYRKQVEQDKQRSLEIV